MAAKQGRPRTRIDEAEVFGAFARMPQAQREIALKVMTAVHAALSPVAAVEPEVQPQQEPAVTE